MMKAPEATTLVGEHVRLVPLGNEHTADLFEAGQYDDIWTWLPWTRPERPEDMVRQVALALEDPTRLPFAVLVEGRAIGTTSYGDIDLSVGGMEIGWTWYTPSVWATAVNPECKLLLLGHAFDELGAGRVHLKTDGLNARSQAAIRKLGATYDGTLRHHRLRGDGSVRDSAYFSVLASEWPAVRDGLRARLGRV
ncbi:MAG: family acetyltransferase [Frankiales bacterium]|jgi:RimJ/RimL family protein N-acetyltransferase|nr:family acetyltransferase [Frankiales bacterium]